MITWLGLYEYSRISKFFLAVSILFDGRHYFNNIYYSEVPFYLSLRIFTLIFFFTMYLNKYTIVTYWIMLFNLVSFLLYITKWFYDITIESTILGRYTKKVRAALVFGFFLFLLSEIMLFSGFFWSFFDRIFNITYATFNMSQLNGFELILWYKIPLLATFLLLTSGYILNYSFYLIKIQSYMHSVCFTIMSLFLAYCFIYLQFLEYQELTFTITDSVYSSLFFLLTGFHGMHVIVGSIFIAYSTIHLTELTYSNTKYLGFAIALIYWHFVDIIWVFLFLFIYTLNNFDFIFIVKKLYHLYYLSY
jgi:cytochrome c oxidase subunit 3